MAYRTIVADPPWKLKGSQNDGRPWCSKEEGEAIIVCPDCLFPDGFPGAVQEELGTR